MNTSSDQACGDQGVSNHLPVRFNSINVSRLNELAQALRLTVRYNFEEKLSQYISVFVTILDNDTELKRFAIPCRGEGSKKIAENTVAGMALSWLEDESSRSETMHLVKPLLVDIVQVDSSEDWIALLNKFCQEEPCPRLEWQDHQSGTDFTATCTVELDPFISFGVKDAVFDSKQAARRSVARVAILYFRERGWMPNKPFLRKTTNAPNLKRSHSSATMLKPINAPELKRSHSSATMPKSTNAPNVKHSLSSATMSKTTDAPNLNSTKMPKPTDPPNLKRSHSSTTVQSSATLPDPKRSSSSKEAKTTMNGPNPKPSQPSTTAKMKKRAPTAKLTQAQRAKQEHLRKVDRLIALYRELEIPQPSYQIFPEERNPALYSGAAYFHKVPWLAEAVGRVKNVRGRNAARRECTKGILAKLEQVKRSRMGGPAQEVAVKQEPE
ncbi:hypothetical protein MBLNU459_g2328t1 [Dothideomycetes sp. NU459]